MAHSLHWNLAMTRRHRATRGFTLIELMIVVVIVAVLAVLAVVGYRSLVTSSHMTEATQMVQSIRTAQEAYHAETQTYVSTTTALWTGLYPAQPGTTPTKTGWGASISGACPALPGSSPNCWSALPLHVDSAVMFGYGTIGGTAGTLPSVVASPLTVTFPSATPMDWYIISALGAVNGNLTNPTYVLGTSWTNDLFTMNENN